MKIDFIDVRRAYFHAGAQRGVYVQLSEEFGEGGMGCMVMKATYGTRDAATNWQEEVAKEMLAWGYARGRYNPCLYFHTPTALKSHVHVDDCASVGS